MNFKQQFTNLETEFITLWGEYTKLHNELDLFRGKPLKEENTNDINRIVREIQDKFIEMYPLMIFVMERYAFCNKAMSDYNKFIKDIREAGAVEEKIVEGNA